MESTEKINELIALLNMNQELYHSELTNLAAKVDSVFNEKIKSLSGQLISGRYSSQIQRDEKSNRWNWMD